LEKARQRAIQATPLLTVPESGDLYMWRKRQTDSWSAESTRQIERRRKREKPLLALFISTSNEHILDKTMV
jgi:hypothetical protein